MKQNWLRVTLWIFVFNVILWPGSMRATLWYDIAVDTATINSDETLTENSVTYATAKNGQWNVPGTFTSGAFDGTSLKLSLPTTTNQIAPDGKNTDRFEYELVQNTNPVAPGFAGQAVYVGFAFKIISSQTQSPTNGGIIFWQSWQGTPYAPPVRLDLKAPSAPGQPWPNRLFVQNNDTGPYTTNAPFLVYNGYINADTWYSYVVELRPDYADSGGYIKVWTNGVIAGQYLGKVGYTPQSQGGLTNVLDSMLVKFGLYRSRPNPNITFGFDDIGYGSSYTDVEP